MKKGKENLNSPAITAQIKATLVDLMTNSKNDETRLSAAKLLLSRFLPSKRELEKIEKEKKMEKIKKDYEKTQKKYGFST